MNQHKVKIITTIDSQSDAPSEETLRLLDAARAIAHNSYSPYSHFRVGAALLLENGEIITGCNQENSAYPSGLCAERVTLFYANAHYPDQKVLRLLIYAETDKGPVSDPITPCGACRQVLIEKENVQGSPIKITLAGKNDLYNIDSVADLMPLSFVPSSLEG